MRIGKIVEDVELVRLDELATGDAPVDEAPADGQPQPAAER
ncbi:MAG: hypothetical protein ACOC96_10640 [Actinomycetota bacterium]